jgi:outer membrane protein assembly factor BamB
MLAPNHHTFLCAVVLTLTLIGSAIVLAAPQSWPEFRGPGGQGHANVSNVPLKWSETENVRWKVAIPGKGWSTPVVLDDQIWITTSLEDGKSLRALCVHFDSGKIAHNIEIFEVAEPEPLDPKNNHAAPTSIVENERVYVHFGHEGTAAISTKTGEVIWRNSELPVDHRSGPGNSPVLHGDRLFINFDGIDVQRIAALDKNTGKLVWLSNRSAPIPVPPAERRAFATPLIIEHEGQTLLITPGPDQMQAYDVRDGEEVWHIRYKGYSLAPRPLFSHGKIYFCTGFNHQALWAVRPGGKGNVTDTHVVWRQPKLVPRVASPIIVDNRIFMVNDKGILTSLDPETGDEIWKGRLGGNYTASPIYADGHLFYCNEEGEVTVLKPGPEPEVVAVNKLDGVFMASPAVVDGALILRTDTHLYRVGK